MKKETHPEYHKITVVMTDGTTFETYSTYGKEGGRVETRHRLQIAPGLDRRWTASDRPWWTPVARFKKKYDGFLG